MTQSQHLPTSSAPATRVPPMPPPPPPRQTPGNGAPMGSTRVQAQTQVGGASRVSSAVTAPSSGQRPNSVSDRADNVGPTLEQLVQEANEKGISDCTWV
jgi:hypothetical protein